MSNVTMKQLLEAGVHFGHQSRRWNPKMKPYIYTDRNGIYIIDLKKTLRLLRDATKFVREEVAKGATVLFVGTKKQAKEIIQSSATEANMHFINSRWLGGLLTNFKTVRKSVQRLIDLDTMFEDGSIEKYHKKEQAALSRERNSLEKNLGGIKRMHKLPDILFVIDPSKETIAVREGKKLGITIVGVVDTNCDPDPIDIVIPANDDAIRSIRLMVEQIADACKEGAAAREAMEQQDLSPDQMIGVPLSAEELEEHFQVYQAEEGSVAEAPASDAAPQPTPAPVENPAAAEPPATPEAAPAPDEPQQ